MRSKRVGRAAGTLLIVAAAGLRAIVSSSEAASPPANAAATIGLEGWIEGVVGEPIAGGKIALAGWAADRAKGTPVHKVEIFLDGKPIGLATIDVPREDVAKVTGRPDFAKAGWTAVIDLQGVAPGKHRISAIAQGESGGRQSLHGDKQIVVKPSGPAPTIAPAVQPGP